MEELFVRKQQARMEKRTKWEKKRTKKNTPWIITVVATLQQWQHQHEHTTHTTAPSQLHTYAVRRSSPSKWVNASESQHRTYSRSSYSSVHFTYKITITITWRWKQFSNSTLIFVPSFRSVLCFFVVFFFFFGFFHSVSHLPIMFVIA